MKVVLSLLLLVVGLAVAQHFGSAKHNFGFQFPSSKQSQFNTFSGSQGQSSNRNDRNVHATNNGREYHFSWKRNPNRVFSGGEAFSYCSGLGRGWAAAGISSRNEWNYLKGVLESLPGLKYFWTGGSKTSRGWTWATGENFGSFEAWSSTGLEGTAQPDDRDRPENCLGVLKNVYRDGTTWHDINCRHRKHVVCEKV